MNKIVFLASLALFACVRLYARPASPEAGERVIVFRFPAGDDMFYVPWADNRAQFETLSRLLDEHRTEIASGRMPVRVDSYCASLPRRKENLRMAGIRANRVKSELITQRGLKEADFVTASYAHAYQDNKDAVVVTLRIPAKEEPGVTAAGVEPEMTVKQERQPEPAVEKEAARGSEQPEPVTAALPVAKPASSVKPYDFALRTNLLYDALLLPTLGVEWRISRDFSLKLDGSFSRWGNEHGKVQKVWLVSPGIRWHLLRDKRFYAGVTANYGQYNIYKYAIGGLMRGGDGHQGHLWSAGLAAGYHLPLWHCLSADFNLGLGYTRSEYDSFYLDGGKRMYRKCDSKKHLWGPTQAGISLVWAIGQNKSLKAATGN